LPLGKIKLMSIENCGVAGASRLAGRQEASGVAVVRSVDIEQGWGMEIWEKWANDCLH
jgi:hypothetical protein